MCGFDGKRAANQIPLFQSGGLILWAFGVAPILHDSPIVAAATNRGGSRRVAKDPPLCPSHRFAFRERSVAPNMVNVVCHA